MAAIPGTIPLGGTIAPTDSEDVYGTHIANFGRGGVHHVATLAERNAITAERRVEGMLCTVADGGSGNPIIYQLVGGTDNANWKELETGGGGTPLNVYEVCGGFRRIQSLTVPAQTTVALTIPLTATYSALVNNDLFQLQNEGGGVIIKKEGNFLLSYTLEVRNGVMGDLYESYIYQDGGWIVRQQTQMSGSSFTMQDSCVIHAREGNVITLRMRNEGSSAITVTVTGLWIIYTGVKGDKGDKGDGSATNCLCQVTWSNVTLASNSSPLVSGTEKMRLGTVLRMSQYGEYIEVTQACVCMFTVRLRSPSIGGVFDGPATYNVSLRRYKGGGSQQETVVESRSFVINWQKNTLDFSMPAIVYANTGDRFFLRVMQYGAGTAENPPDRTGAQVDMTVWTVI